MVEKRLLILESIIKEYIKQKEPIGSKQLQASLRIEISSATIRSYLKKLVDEGKLSQPHISSGRVPTDSALIDYWKDRLLPLNVINISLKNLKESARENRIFCIVKFYKPNRLIEILNINSRYTLLVFEFCEIVIDYSNESWILLKELLLLDIRDIQKVAKRFALEILYSRIELFLRDEKIEKGNAHEFLNMIKEQNLSEKSILEVLDGGIVEQIGDGLYFDKFVPNGYMAIKQNALIENRVAKLFCLGKISRDFENFYNLAKEL